VTVELERFFYQVDLKDGGWGGRIKRKRKYLMRME
jgi:hypothetical protein